LVLGDQVTRWLALALLACLGLVCGVVVGASSGAFVPICGDPCSTERLFKMVAWGVGLLIAFPLIGHFTFKRVGQGAKQTAATAGVLASLAVLPAAGLYGYELHRLYWRDGGPLGLPDMFFGAMVIATKPVNATAYGGTENVHIRAWERCAIGTTTCDQKPRHVEAICLGSRSTVTIEERDWSSFQRIKEEDFDPRGLPKDMNLCDE
jgi:hypothetical protein